MLEMQWCEADEMVSLRCDPESPDLRQKVEAAIGLELPGACATTARADVRVVWAGPDDWFVIGLQQRPQPLIDQLRQDLTGMHYAVTDFSSGYAILRLAGTAAPDILAQGCPMDLHPRVFRPGTAVGSVFFKTSIWLWQPGAEPMYEMLVRTSFAGYVATMLIKACEVSGCRLAERSFNALGPNGDRAANTMASNQEATPQEGRASLPA